MGSLRLGSTKRMVGLSLLEVPEDEVVEGGVSDEDKVCGSGWKVRCREARRSSVT